MIGFIAYELTSKQSNEGKLKAEGNGWTHKPCDRMKGHITNERKQRMNEQTRQSNKWNASKTNGNWTNSTNKRPQIRQLSDKCLNTPIPFQNEEKQCQFGSEYRKVFLSGFKKISRNWFDNAIQKKPTKL